MPTINQIYNLLNQTSNECWGLSAPTVKDLSGLIALGETIAPNGTWTAGADKYLNNLVDRIGKTVVRTLKKRIDLRNLIIEGFEFGAILQKIDVQPTAAKLDTSWTIGENNYATDLFTISKPTVNSRLFTNFDAWKVDVDIPDRMFYTAFTSEAGVTSFITAIIESISISIDYQINKMNHLNLSNFIAEKVKNSNNGVVPLVTLYNSATSSDIATGESSLYNADFLKWSSRHINNLIYYMGDDSSFYNVGDMIRATSREDMHVIFSKAFSSSVSTMLQSGTFHKELVELPMYDEVSYFQINATDFTNKHKINLVPSSGGDAIVVNNVIGVLADRMALGSLTNERWSATDRINSERRTRHTEGCTIGYFNDLTENGIVLTLN